MFVGDDFRSVEEMAHAGADDFVHLVLGVALRDDDGAEVLRENGERFADAIAPLDGM